MPPVPRIIGDSPVEPPDEKDGKDQRRDKTDDKAPPGAHLDICGRVDEFLSNSCRAILPGSDKDKKTADQEGNSPDPVLVFEEGREDGRGESEEEAAEDYNPGCLLAIPASVDESSGADLDHGNKRSKSSENHGQEKNGGDEETAGHAGK